MEKSLLAADTGGAGGSSLITKALIVCSFLLAESLATGARAVTTGVCVAEGLATATMAFNGLFEVTDLR